MRSKVTLPAFLPHIAVLSRHCLVYLCTPCALSTVVSTATANMILIDDFNFDQQGIRTDQFASYDTIDFDSPIGEHRQLWGGGASIEGNCQATKMAVSISGGTMGITNSPDCYGAGSVRWFGSETVNLSQYQSIRLDAVEIVGSIRVRISIAKDLLGARQFDATLEHSGEHQYYFSDFREYGSTFELSEVRLINISLGVEQGEYVALDSVSLVGPEPESATVCLTCVLATSVWRSNFLNALLSYA